jgi:hypothetical protein
MRYTRRRLLAGLGLAGLSLETHWRGGGTAEASTRASMDGLKKALTKAGISC